MSRSCFTFHYTSFEETKKLIVAELTNSGYKNKSENGENVWKNGSGMMTAMKYIKIEFSQNQEVKIYGWIRAIASSEQNLDGIFAALPKKQVLKVIKKIGDSIK